jgi:hypothetical protein
LIPGVHLIYHLRNPPGETADFWRKKKETSSKPQARAGQPLDGAAVRPIPEDALIRYRSQRGAVPGVISPITIGLHLWPRQRPRAAT